MQGVRPLSLAEAAPLTTLLMPWMMPFDASTSGMTTLAHWIPLPGAQLHLKV